MSARTNGTAFTFRTTVYLVDFEPWRGRSRKVKVYYSERYYCVMTFIPMSDEHFGPKVWCALLKRRREIRMQHAISQNRPPAEATVLDAAMLRKPVHSFMPTTKPVEEPSPVAAPKPQPAPVRPSLLITAANSNEAAATIWNALPGSYDEKAALLKTLIGELRSHQERDKPVETVDETKYVDKIIGKPLSKLAMINIPICGVAIRAHQLFKLANTDDHPMQKECAAFIERNRISLRSMPGAGVKPVTVVERAA